MTLLTSMAFAVRGCKVSGFSFNLTFEMKVGARNAGNEVDVICGPVLKADRLTSPNRGLFPVR